MAKNIKVRRPGLDEKTKKTPPFVTWLADQPRSALTYASDLPRLEQKGWAAEDFMYEARERGVELRIMTIYKWRAGHQPRALEQFLRKAFPTVKF